MGGQLGRDKAYS